MKPYKYSMLVLIEFNNTGPFVERFVSNKPIEFDDVIAFVEDRDDFNEDRDAITLLDEPTETRL